MWCLSQKIIIQTIHLRPTSSTMSWCENKSSRCQNHLASPPCYTVQLHLPHLRLSDPRSFVLSTEQLVYFRSGGKSFSWYAARSKLERQGHQGPTSFIILSLLPLPPPHFPSILLHWPFSAAWEAFKDPPLLSILCAINKSLPSPSLAQHCHRTNHLNPFLSREKVTQAKGTHLNKHLGCHRLLRGNTPVKLSLHLQTHLLSVTIRLSISNDKDACFC